MSDRRVHKQYDNERGKLVRVVDILKYGKAPGIDGKTPEVVKRGEDPVVYWMHLLCRLA